MKLYPCQGYKCQCANFVYGRKGQYYIDCVCGCTAGTHGIVESKFDFAAHKRQHGLYVDEAVVPTSKPDTAQKLRKDASQRPQKAATATSVSTGAYTTGELREALRSAGIAVGQRGRLSPEQQLQALQLLENQEES